MFLLQPHDLWHVALVNWQLSTAGCLETVYSWLEVVPYVTTRKGAHTEAKQ